MPTGDVFTARIIFRIPSWICIFPGLTYAVLSLFFAIRICIRRIFSLFAPEAEEGQAETPDENDVLMQKAAGLAVEFRFGEEGKEVVTVIGCHQRTFQEVTTMAGNFADLTAVLTPGFCPFF